MAISLHTILSSRGELDEIETSRIVPLFTEETRVWEETPILQRHIYSICKYDVFYMINSYKMKNDYPKLSPTDFEHITNEYYNYYGDDIYKRIYCPNSNYFD